MKVFLFLSTSVAEIESKVKLYGTITTVCTVLSILLFVIAVVLFFVFKIPKIISIKSGHEAKKVIKSYESGRELSPSKVLKRRAQASAEQMFKTEQLPVNEEVGTKTTLLSNETTLLGNETTILSQDNSGVTTLLSAMDNGQPMWSGERKFVLLRNEIYIHTQEIV